MQRVQTKKVIGYFMLPGIVPRVQSLFASGFGYIALLMAHIYSAVRLLPHNHPYLNTDNVGKFGIRHVIGEAANNLVIKKENFDQIIIFIALMIGMLLLLAQIVLAIYGVTLEFVAPAMAQSIFTTQQPEQDIAMILLDRVFGVPDMFGSCVSTTGVDCLGGSSTVSFPFPFHHALHEMFRFYSLGLLIVALLIFLYFIVVIIGETAITGTPFGQRFQNVWVPIRLVVAIGLLLPVTHGLNSGQYIVLQAAKMGSGFATNGWKVFNDELAISMGTSSNAAGESTSLIALPATPSVTPLLQAMSIIHGCAYDYWHQNRNTGNATIPSDKGYIVDPYDKIKPYLVKNSVPWQNNTDAKMEITPTTTYLEALSFFNNSDVTIRFGIEKPNPPSSKDDEIFRKYKGEVAPTCGEVRVNTFDVSFLSEPSVAQQIAIIENNGGAPYMQQFYFKLVQDMWFGTYDSDKNLIQLSQRLSAVNMPVSRSINTSTDPVNLTQCKIGCNNTALALPSCVPDSNNVLACVGEEPGEVSKTVVAENYQPTIKVISNLAWNDFRTSSLTGNTDPETLSRGWGGAGIWYNKISELNGTFISAVTNVPKLVQYPYIMEQVSQEKMGADASSAIQDIFDVEQLSQEQQTAINDAHASQGDALFIAKSMSAVFSWWNTGDIDPVTEEVVTGSVILDAMNLLFGTNGIIAMRGANANIHPLAQLTAVGKGLVDSAIQNVAASTVTSTLGGPLSVISPAFGSAVEKAGSFLVTTAFMGLTAGLVLYYILPFLPFLYFFFAVGSWIKGIFEAMVGVPLWALAHLRIDGEGLPGSAAMNGYMLIFEIFLRPIMTIVGLVAATVIFTAQVRILNIIWNLVVDNLSGFSGDADTTIESFVLTIERDGIDQFFFTILYTLIVYMLATASFKLIDKIPDNMLRWIGGGVSSFKDMIQDETDGLRRYVALGGLTLGRQGTTALQQLGSETGAVLGKEAGKFSNFKLGK